MENQQVRDEPRGSLQVHVLSWLFGLHTRCYFVRPVLPFFLVDHLEPVSSRYI